MDATDPLDAAEALLADGRIEEAVALIEQAASTNHVGALFRLAAWRLVGSPVPRDLPAARRLLRRAALIGHVDAALLEVALTANGSGAPASWQEALNLLEAAAVDDPVAASQLALVRAMAIDAEGHPIDLPKPEILHSTAKILRFPELFTPRECAHVAHVAGDLLEPATVIDPNTGRLVTNPIRTSDAAVIGPMREDLVIRALNRRLAAISGTDVTQGEALTVLRYRPGQQFREHFDALPRTRNQRAKTILIYLNEGFGGGETVFPRAGISIRPKAGDAILFSNSLPDGTIDPLSRHAGAPVRTGVKWLATRWLRERPFDIWSGPEAA